MTVHPSIDAAAKSGALEGAAVCLGNFDGVHLGHRALFDAARGLGKVAALTFQPHPGKVLQADLAPRLICQLPRKLELLAQVGVEETIVQPFDLSFARSTPADFERWLFADLRVGAVVIGHDYTYGAKRAGTRATLEVAARAANAKLQTVPAVTLDGVVISSSKVREYILEGRVTAAQRLLGRFFDLDGTVVTGQGRGRTIGFPTANIDTQNELRPGAGVYAVRVKVGDKLFGGAANIGVKPTFGGGEVTIEAHLFGFQGDLYGQKLRVEFVERLRGEQRFASAAELAGQIGRDLERAREAIARISL